MAIMLSALISISVFSPPASSQLLPEADLECDDSVEIEPSSGSRAVLVNCEVTNPTSGSETIEIAYESEFLTASGPGSITVGGGESVSFQVSVLSGEGQSAGAYVVNVSVVVTEWNGIPVTIFGFSDEDSTDVEIVPYTSCSLSPPSGLFVDAGEDVSFSARYDCNSNENREMDVSLHLLEIGDTQEGMWPSGFNDMSDGVCSVQNPMGSVECQFILTTPPNLESKWEGCLIIVDEWTDPGWSCSSSFAFPLTVNEKEGIGPSVGIDVNGTFLEDLGVTEENQDYIIAGGVALVMLVVGIILIRSRRS
tara:strand:+ start:117 stop:1040 length:924 start_codon:yes stop_codon:yes gene_type:complete